MSGWDWFWAGFYFTGGVGWALLVGLVIGSVIWYAGEFIERHRP